MVSGLDKTANFNTTKPVLITHTKQGSITHKKRYDTISHKAFYITETFTCLPDDIQSAPSVSAFRRLLTTFLFHHSFPDVIL